MPNPPMVISRVLLPSLLVIAFFVSGCAQQYPKQPLFTKDLSNLREASNQLLVFVGEKISWEELEPEPGGMDVGCKATYKILVRVYGDYAADTITFEAYDHYGIPPFLAYQHVLLYVSKEDGKYYHEKYQYNDVYRTIDGRWAGAYSLDYSRLLDRTIDISPAIIPFARRVAYPTSIFYSDGMIGCIDYYYKPPYFRIEGDSAVVVYGNYIEELFLLKKHGVLSARQLFGEGDTSHAIIPGPVVDLEPPDSTFDAGPAFTQFANSVFTGMQSGDRHALLPYALDSLLVCQRLLDGPHYLGQAEVRLRDTGFLRQVLPDGFLRLSESRLDTGDLLPFAQSAVTRDPDGFRLKHMSIIARKKSLVRFSIHFEFIPTSSGYRLYSYHDDNDRTCRP